VVFDGEVVALDVNGVPDFGLLQARMHRRNPSPGLLATTPVVYYVFDVLHLAGADLTRHPYEARRGVLEELHPEGESVKVPPWFVNVAGSFVLSTAEKHGLEGVVAKQLRSRYQSGRRSRSWIKTPLRRSIEVVIGGWTPGQGRRAGTVGALLLGGPGGAAPRYGCARPRVRRARTSGTRAVACEQDPAPRGTDRGPTVGTAGR